MNRLILSLSFLTFLLAASCVQARQQPAAVASEASPLLRSGPTKVGGDIRGRALAAPGTLIYYGGSVMKNAAKVHLIFYGPPSEWSTSQVSLVKSFISSLTVDYASSAPSVLEWWRVVTKYRQYTAENVTSSVSLGQTARNYGTLGLSLAMADIAELIKSYMASGQFPALTTDFYYVLTSKSVTVNGFCSKYCGFHSHFMLGSSRIVYGLAGNPETQCDILCKPHHVFKWPAVSGDVGIEAQVNTLAHELAESATDPYGTAWHFDSVATGGSSYVQIADPCVLSFGPVYTAGNGGKYNLVGAGGSKFIIQQIYGRFVQKCASTG